ncbi:MAG: DUF4190 domain-containing protein [Flavobacteriales bacterium]
MKKINSLLMLIIVLFLASCATTNDLGVSVQKRKYRNGFSVNGFNKTNPVRKQENIKFATLAKLVVDDNDTLYATDNNEITFVAETPLSNSVVEVATINSKEDSTSVKTENISSVRKVLKETKNRLLKPLNVQDGATTHWGAIAGMVLGILALVTYYGAFLFAVLGLIFSAIALSKIKNEPDKYKGKNMAKAGLVCSIVALALILILIALI